MVSLYIHIPFCKKKCPYCHFYVIADKECFKDELLIGLQLEWQRILPQLAGKTIDTIYFGGGTPTLFGVKRIAAVLELIQSHFRIGPEVEITIETNPEEPIDYKSLRAHGINRLSFGIQSLHENELAILGRGHSPKESLHAVHSAHSAGFDNITIDLMYDLPEQTLASWQKSLKRAAQLPITHLSLYNLTIEPHTAFERKEKALRQKMPDEESSVKMYSMAQEHLLAHGFCQYEISAFCRDNLYSRHNIGYWTGRHFFGLGPSSFSFDGERRFRNVANLLRYCKQLLAGTTPIDFAESLSPQKQKKELLALQLRLMEGADLKRFQPIEDETLKAINQLVDSGLLQVNNDQVQMTSRGILFYDTIATEII